MENKIQEVLNNLSEEELKEVCEAIKMASAFQFEQCDATQKVRDIFTYAVPSEYMKELILLEIARRYFKGGY